MCVFVCVYVSVTVCMYVGIRFLYIYMCVCVCQCVYLCVCFMECAGGLSFHPAFDNTGSMGFPPGRVVYPRCFTLGDYLPFLCRKYWSWPKTHLFLFIFSFPCFPVFPLLLSLNYIVPMSAACCEILPQIIYIYWVGGVWVHLLGVKRPAFVLFLFYVNVSGMGPRFRLFSQPLTIPAPWVLLHARWAITLVLWFHLGECLLFPCGE